METGHYKGMREGDEEKTCLLFLSLSVPLSLPEGALNLPQHMMIFMQACKMFETDKGYLQNHKMYEVRRDL